MSTGTDYLDHAYHPGGRLDALQHDEHHQAATDPGYDEAGIPQGYVLPTSEVMPAETIPRMIALSSSNPFLRVLPRDMDRRRAVLLAIDNDVVFVETVELAQTVAAQVVGGAAAGTLTNGAYWPKNVPLGIESRDQLFAVVTTTTGLSRVSLIVERHARQYPPV